MRISEKLQFWIDLIKDDAKMEELGVDRAKVLNPKLRSWVLEIGGKKNAYPDNPTNLNDDEWHLIWRQIEHRALEFHVDFLRDAERGYVSQEWIEDNYNDDDFAIWELWFKLALCLIFDCGDNKAGISEAQKITDEDCE